MKYVLDTSAIINLISRLGNKSIDLFKESLTTDLAYYEIGNFLWKIGREDLIKDFLNVLKFIHVENVNLNEEVLAIAIKEKLTYYDATYLFLSRKYNATLVSDDKDLINKGAKKSSEVMI